MIKKSFLGILFLVALRVLGQDIEPISADRPDQNEGTYTLPKKAFQIESGLLFSFGDITDDLMIRYGLLEGTEIRLETNFGSNIWNSKFHDLTFSAKQRILNKEHLPALTLHAFITYDHNAEQKLTTDMIMASDYEFADQWSLTYNIGTSEGYSNLVMGGQLGFSASDKLDIFTEYYGTYGKVKPFHSFGAGLFYRINNNFLVDMAVERQFFSENIDYYFATGFSYRFNVGNKKRHN